MATYSAETKELFTNWLDHLLESVHPLMAESFYFAAIPHFYSADYFQAIRQIDDNRSLGIVERLTAYAFIEKLSDDEQPLYRVSESERRQLNLHCIAGRPDQYRLYHQRALAYRRQHPDPNHYVQNNEVLYHALIINPREGINLLSKLHRRYFTNRQMAAIDQLIKTAREAHFYIRALGDDDEANYLDDLLTYMQARVTQMGRNWRESETLIAPLIDKPDSPLFPYALRLLGYIAYDREQYVAAIRHFQSAIAAFDKPQTAPLNIDNHLTDRAETLIDLGDANTQLANNAAGIHLVQRASGGTFAPLRHIAQLILSLPLLAYLSKNLGWHVWRPRFWPVLEQLDWVVARFFSKGAAHYQAADPILEASGAGELGTVADEKLAALHLQLGDAHLSEESYRTLIKTDTTLGDYRLAKAHLGRAMALQALFRYSAAREEAQIALPMLRRFNDTLAEAQALTLIGDAWLADAYSEQAITAYQTALPLFEALNRHNDTTYLYDKLVELGIDTPAPQLELRYPLHFRHRLTRWFRRISTMLLLAGILPVALLTIKLAVPTIPEFNYVVPLLFEQDETVAGVDSAEKDPLDSIPLPPEALSQLNDESSLNIDKQPAAAIDDLQEQVRDSIAVEIVKQLNTSNSDITDNFRALTFDLLRDPNTLFVQAVLILLGYLGVSTLVGVRILLGSRPEDLDLSEGRKVVCINGDTIRIGIEDPLAQLQLSQVNTIVYADEAFWDSTQFDANESRTILHTADETLFIDGTAAHYRRLVARVRSLLPDAVGEIDLNITWFRSYMGGFFWVCTTLITLLALWTELSSRVAFLPTDLLTTPILFGYSLSNLQRYLFLGFLLPPLHWFVIHPIRVRRHMPWHIRLADYRPYWFAAAGIVLALFAGVSNLSDFLNTTPDILRPIAAIGLAGAAAWALWHDRKQLLQGQKIVAMGVTLACLLCVIWSGRYLTHEVATSHFGIMGLRHQRLAQTADKTQQIAELTEALRNYDRAIEWGEVWLWAQKERLASAELYASRATANLQLALLDPDQASLFASHAAADYAAALKRIADPANPPTWVANAYFGQGYAYYINDQFEESLDAFLQANQLAPANPLTLDSIGTLYLNLGTAGQDSCSNFEQASNFLSQAAAIPTQPPAYQALSYRTNSTALFLLSQERSCNGDLVQAVIASPSAQASYCVTAALNPDNRREVALFEASADSAAAASEILPSDASLHNLAARLLYAAWSVCDASGAATRTRLVTEAVPAAEHASQLDPSSGAFRVWRDLIYDEATVGSIRRGDQRVGSGAYAEALDYYQLVAENTADVRAILRSGLAYAALGDSENALAAYQQGLAAAGDDERIITEAAQRLRQLERSLGVRFTQIEALFPASAIAPQLPVTPRRAFELSLAALDKGDQNEAERMFTHGLTLLQPTDWETLQSMLLLLDARRDKAVLHAVLRQQWPLLRELASDKNDIVGAHSVAFTALVIGDAEQAGWWYQEMLARTLRNPSQYDSALRPFRQVLRSHWETVGVKDGYLLVEGLDATQDSFLRQYPALDENGKFWRWRAWMQYHMAWAAFLADRGGEDLVDELLDNAQPDADRAFKLGSPGSAEPHTYLKEGAWGWFYWERASEAFTAGDFKLAYTNYVLSAENYKAHENTVAQRESADAAFRAGLTALLIGDDKAAIDWYEEGLERATRFEQYETIDTARGELISAELTNNTLRKEILSWLERQRRS